MRLATWAAAGIALVVAATHAATAAASWKEKTLTTFEEELALLAAVDARHDDATVELAGTSVEGRPINALIVGPGAEARWRVMFVGVQHGDEVAGREAILELVREYDANPAMLPKGVGMVLVPSMNPDGFIAGKRRNAAGKDLNRDHLFQTQPETRAMHALQRTTMAHLVIDCHEYGRDSSAWGERGLYRWPTIMFGAGNLPYASPLVLAANHKLIEQVRPLFADDPTAYDDYIVGGVPPHEEQRPSNLEIFDLRNGMAMYGGMSMIIESGRFSSHKPPLDDLDVRTQAYLRILRYALAPPDRDELRTMVGNERQQLAPDQIPTRSMFAATAPKPRTMRAGRLADDTMVEIVTHNYFDTPTHKGFVARPAAYAIAPEHRDALAPIIERHGLAGHELALPIEVEVERVKIDKLNALTGDWEDPSDIEADTIVMAASKTTLPAGTLLFTTDEPTRGMRTCLVLEPGRTYGLYSIEPFKQLITEPDRLAPVMRVTKLPDNFKPSEQP